MISARLSWWRRVLRVARVGSFAAALGRAGLAATLLAAPCLAFAQELAVGVGSTFSLGSGSLDLGCSDLNVGGTFNTDTGIVQHARDVILAGGALLNGGSGAIFLGTTYRDFEFAR